MALTLTDASYRIMVDANLATVDLAPREFAEVTSLREQMHSVVTTSDSRDPPTLLGSTDRQIENCRVTLYTADISPGADAMRTAFLWNAGSNSRR